MTSATFELESAAELAGVWKADVVHSSVRFAVRHVVSTFRGELPDFEAELRVAEDGARLVGRGRVASIQTRDETLTAHLFAPDFFDSERFPEIGLTSTSVERAGDRISVEAELRIKETTRPVRLTGTIEGPAADPFGGTRLALALETAIDRRDFGLEWGMTLPGGGLYLGNEVTLSAELELVKDT